jgi:predicted NBD/HSP70 family sugar kinase
MDRERDRDGERDRGRVTSRQAGTNLAGLRDHNTALVLGLLRAAGGEGSSRVQIAAETGLTPQAISKITARLLDEGLVRAAGQSASTGGKPRTLLTVRPEGACAVGVELDRSHTAILVVDLAGATRRRWSADVGLATGTPEETVAMLAEQVREAVSGAPDGARLLGVGVGCRGPLDYDSGVLHRPAGLPAWDGFPLREALAARLEGAAVVLDKDTNAAVLAAPAPAPGSTAYLHLGDGLGAGMLLNGAVYRGVRTNAGEFGHQILQPDGPLCTCGARGCLEALCMSALDDGDLEGAARWLGIGAANLVRLLDIDRILLGGHRIFDAPELYVRAVADQVAAHLPDPGWQDVQVSVTPAGAEAVAVGAARLVLDAVHA